MKKMIPQCDIQRLRDIPIRDVAERLGLNPGRGKCICPFHDDKHPSLTLNKARNSYHCFVCGAKGGGPIDLVMGCLNKSFVDACRWLADENNVIIAQQHRQRAQATDSMVTTDVVHLNRLMEKKVLNDDARRFLFDERKISREVVERVGISSISSPVPMSRNVNGGWFIAPSLLIPYTDIDGNLLSVQARYLGGEKGKPRFLFPRGSRCGIFNLQVLRDLGDDEPIFITEGTTDCLAMLSAGHKAIAIPSATMLKQDDVALLRRFRSFHTNCHICPDCDRPGECLYLDLKAVFPSLVRHQLPAGFKDYGEYWKEMGHKRLTC